MTAKEKIKKLQLYVEKCNNDAASAKNPHKKAFFEREVARSSQQIMKLMA